MTHPSPLSLSQALQSESISEEDAKFSLEELAIHAEDLDEANGRFY